MANRGTALVLLGPPGSGKSTISGDIASRCDAALIETGQLLRQEISRKSPLGSKLKPFLDAGKLAPSEWVAEVIQQEVGKIHNSWILFDGFPRREDEIEPFFQICEQARIQRAAAVVLQIPRSLAVKRLVGRRVCPTCHTVYNIYFDPPKREGICDRCGSALEQRNDDTVNLVKKRLEVYDRETKPVIEYFQTHHPQETYEISADQAEEETVNSILSMMGKDEGV